MLNQGRMMKVSIAALMTVLLAAAPAAAADKTHQQIMAEIRMLQEQQQQLQALLGGLSDTIKTLTTKIDDQMGATRKAFADQKLLVDGVAEGVRILREKSDDTNVRLSTMAQELESMRQAISSMPAPGAATSPAPGVTGEPTGITPPAGVATAPSNPSPNVSPKQAYDSAFNDYTSGQYDLAVQGFAYYIKMFPTSPLADDAQLNICNSYFAMGNYKEAVAACQKVTSEYAQSDSVPSAYYKLGLSYEGLKQIELARRAYETVVKNYPNALGDASLARQRLDALNKK